MSKILIIFLIAVVTFKQIIFANTQDNTYINTSNITYDEKNNIVELSKNSKINIGNTNILVDQGIVDYNNNKIEVFGNFYLFQESSILSGKNLNGDINLNNFITYDVSFIYDNDLKIDSEKTERSNNLIIFYNNFLTPCEIEGYFDCPTWSLRIDKTEYDIKRDKFTHFDSFFQIADYKLFYLPYFTHYGTKAPRQKGFLTPTIEYNFKGNSGLKIPYYFPVNSYSDIVFTTKLSIDKNFSILESYHLNTLFNRKLTGGNLEIEIDNIKKENNDNTNSTLKLNTKQIISKNTVISANTLITNSVSTTRSTNKEPIRYEDIYFKIENYNFINQDDYLRSEISTVKSFDNTTVNQIPLSPYIKYVGKLDFMNKTSLFTEVDFRILNRESSTAVNPKENYMLNFNNFYIFSDNGNHYNSYNKLSLFNTLNEYKFEHDTSLDRKESKSYFTTSSDIFFRLNSAVTPRLKLIVFQNLIESKNLINEDSNAITFNYENQFSDNRLFGQNLEDNSTRIIYGLENNLDINNQKFFLNLNQSYELNKDKNYYQKINQNSKYSDIAMEAKTNYNNILFKINSRLDQNNLAKKEMSYSLSTNEPIQISLNYHETNKEAYEFVSNDTKSIIFRASKKVNENVSIGYNTNLDLKNNYSPYSESLTLSVHDECSKLEIAYSNRKYNDDYNTTPEEKISINFYMDYLDFFGFGVNNNVFN